MACSYLMSLDDSPSPPRNEKNYTAKEWAKVRAEEWMQTVPSDDPITDVPAPSSPALGESRTFTEEAESGGGATGLKRTVSKSRSPSDTLSHVLELHTARRMKKPSSPSEKVKQGVSIPSQRRVGFFCATHYFLRLDFRVVVVLLVLVVVSRRPF